MMATFIETLPKDFYREREVILLTPAGRMGDGTYVDGYTTADWIIANHADLANATLPLAQNNYQGMKDLGDCWLLNMAQWRKAGVFEVDSIPADMLLEDEEPALTEFLAQRQPIEEVQSEEA